MGIIVTICLVNRTQAMVYQNSSHGMETLFSDARIEIL